MLKLYESPLSGYVQKVKIALLEKGIEFEALPADGLMAGTAGGAFVEANPPKESRLAQWLVRVNQRPSVDKVRKQVEDVVAKLPDLADMLKKGQIKRQYRDHRLEWMLAAGGLPVVIEGIDKGTIRFSRDIR
jgi:glutathione S-transferase